VTVRAAVPNMLSLVAVMAAEPGPPPLTNPLPFTVATAALFVAHVTACPVSALPLASLGVAVSCTVCPAMMLDAAGSTDTVTTNPCNSPASCFRSHPARALRPASSARTATSRYRLVRKVITPH